MIGDVSRYMLAAWKLTARQRTRPASESCRRRRKKEKLQPAILDQWTRYLFRRGSDQRPHLADWRKALAGLDANKDLSADAAAVAKVTAAAQAFQADLQAILRERRRWRRWASR